MKKLFFFIAFLFATANSFSQVNVQGYTRSNGTYVSGYTRSYPTSSSYTIPSYSNTYHSVPTYSTTTYSAPSYPTTSSYTTSSYYTAPVYIGSRGGTYYINSNGNKTYIGR